MPWWQFKIKVLIARLNFCACATSNDKIFDCWTLDNLFISYDFSLDIIILDWNAYCFNVLNIAIGKLSGNCWPYRVLIEWFHRREAFSSTFPNVNHISRFWSNEEMQRWGDFGQFQDLGKWYPIVFKLTRYSTFIKRIEPSFIWLWALLYQRREVHFFYCRGRIFPDAI